MPTLKIFHEARKVGDPDNFDYSQFYEVEECYYEELSDYIRDSLYKFTFNPVPSGSDSNKGEYDVPVRFAIMYPPPITAVEVFRLNFTVLMVLYLLEDSANTQSCLPIRKCSRPFATSKYEAGLEDVNVALHLWKLEIFQGESQWTFLI